MPAPPPYTREALAACFDEQAAFSRLLGSDFTAMVVAAAGEEIRSGGPLAALVADVEGDPIDMALAIRVAGGLHRYALDQPDSPLGALYPTGARRPSADSTDSTDSAALRAAIAAAIESAPAHFQEYLARPPQTNEVSRSGILMAGYLTIAAATGLPLDVREIGASAGLNQFFDQFHYRFGDATWGDAAASVKQAPDWHGPPPPVDAPLSVRTRAACDIAPIDLNDPDAVRRLEAYVWADQPARLERLRGAVSLAQQRGVQVERASADEWLERQLDGRSGGATMVVVHSTMWQYMPGAIQRRAAEAIARAGERARPDAPLAWLSLEPWEDKRKPPVLRRTLWPGGESRDLAVAHPHGASARWHG